MSNRRDFAFSANKSFDVLNNKKERMIYCGQLIAIASCGINGGAMEYIDKPLKPFSVIRQQTPSTLHKYNKKNDDDVCACRRSLARIFLLSVS